MNPQIMDDLIAALSARGIAIQHVNFDSMRDCVHLSGKSVHAHGSLDFMVPMHYFLYLQDRKQVEVIADEILNRVQPSIYQDPNRFRDWYQKMMPKWDVTSTIERKPLKDMGLLIEPIVGIREWKLNYAQPLYLISRNGVQWPHRQKLVAYCNKALAHDAPDEDCSSECGIYGAYTHARTLS